MASPETVIKLPRTLLTTPPEIQNKIIRYLETPDVHVLRLTSKYFYDIIPPPTHADLLAIEASLEINIDHFACVGCTKMVSLYKFSPSMVKKKKISGGSEARNRFCNDCGRRPLPGLHRWMLGNRWEEWDIMHSYVPFVRCGRCGEIAQAPGDKAIMVCLKCHTFDRERERAAEAVRRVQIEAREQEERRTAREGRRTAREVRRVEWIAEGRAASEFSDYSDRISDSEEEDPHYWDNYEEHAANYSNYS